MRTLIIEADGASRGNPGPASYGAVVRDGDTGELLAERAEAIGHATNNVAEYRGVIAGLEAARDLDPRARVEVRMDSKLVVEQLSGRWQVKHPDMKPLAERARRLFPGSGVTFSWVPRSQNKHADRLANQALDAAKRGEVWSAAVQPAGSGTESAPSVRYTNPDDAALSGGVGTSTASATDDGTQHAGTPKAGTRHAGTQHAGTQHAESRRAGTQLSAFDTESQGHVAAPRSVPAAGGSADLGAPTRLLLLRHGSTALTGEKRFSGLGGDPELIPEGLAQAGCAARRFAPANGSGDPRYGRIDAIITSPLRRAQQTAHAVAAAAGIEPRLDDGFRELDFGSFEGLTFAEARAQYAEQLAAFLAATANRAPAGESVEQVAARAAVARDRALARFPRKTVLIVTHVTPIKTLLCQALGAPLDSVHRMELAAASLSVVDYYADGAANVRCINDTAHLYL